MFRENVQAFHSSISHRVVYPFCFPLPSLESSLIHGLLIVRFTPEKSIEAILCFFIEGHKVVFDCHVYYVARFILQSERRIKNTESPLCYKTSLAGNGKYVYELFQVGMF